MNEGFGHLIEPPRVPFHFGAPGWYVLAFMLALVAIFIIYFLVRCYKANYYRRMALNELSEYEGKEIPTSLRLYHANMLMKRIAMARYGRTQTASLAGKDWIEFLNRTCSKNIFDAKDQAFLRTQLYDSAHGPAGKDSGNEFISKSKRWIRKHHRIKINGK
jgi:hypothetical protein